MVDEQIFIPKPTLPEVLEIREKIRSEFKDLIFDEGPHVYTLNGVEIPSVSHMCHNFEVPFDEEKIAADYAVKNGKTKEYWLDDWHYKALVSTTTGTQVHAYGESLGWLRNGHPELITPDQRFKYNPEKNWLVPTRPKEKAILKFFNDLHPTLHFVMAEAKVYTGKNRQLTNLKQDYAGTFDILFYYKDPVDSSRDGLCIFDYKGLPLTTPILTTYGWRTMGDLSVGNTVFDEDGEPTNIIHCSEIHHNPCFEILFDNGDRIVADHEHRWKVLVNDEEKVITTEEVKKTLEGSENPPVMLIRCCGVIKGEQSIKGLPYDIGCLIAKGDKLSVPKNVSLLMPFERILMLGGIIDKGCHLEWKLNVFLFRAKEKWQGDFVAELAASLGLKVTRTGDELKNVIFSYPNESIMGKPYLKDLKISLSSPYRRIVEVKEVETVPTRCIEVDSEKHTFLAGRNFIVTHNTNESLVKDYSHEHNKMMLPPFDDLYSESKGKYTLQLSAYQIPLEDIGLKVIARRLVWLKSDENYELIPLPCVTDRIRQVF